MSSIPVVTLTVDNHPGDTLASYLRHTMTEAGMSVTDATVDAERDQIRREVTSLLPVGWLLTDDDQITVPAGASTDEVEQVCDLIRNTIN